MFIIEGSICPPKNAGHSPLQAADELGTDYKIIARNFKNLTGMTPAEFARKQSNQFAI